MLHVGNTPKKGNLITKIPTGFNIVIVLNDEKYRLINKVTYIHGVKQIGKQIIISRSNNGEIR